MSKYLFCGLLFFSGIGAGGGLFLATTCERTARAKAKAKANISVISSEKTPEYAGACVQTFIFVLVFAGCLLQLQDA